MTRYLFGIDPGVKLHGWAELKEEDGVYRVECCGHDDSDTVEDRLDDFGIAENKFKIAIEVPTYQGPLRTQASILSTSFWAGYFAGVARTAKLFTPIQWKQKLFNRGSHVTGLEVEDLVRRTVLDIPKLTKKATPHVMDAIAFALCLTK